MPDLPHTQLGTHNIAADIAAKLQILTIAQIAPDTEFSYTLHE
jgi:hypothetical protein